MSKWQNDTMLEEALNWIKNNATKMTVCSAQPTTYAEIATYRLAETTMVVGDYTISDGDTSGRKCTVAQKSNISVTANGNATHIVLSGTSSSPDLSGDTLMYIVTCNSQAVEAGKDVSIPAWDIELRDVA